MSVEHTQNLIRAVSILIQTNTPALLVGEPGVAKTAIVEALMSELCTVSDTRIASLSEPVDFGGFPVPQGDRVALLPAAWLARLTEGKGRKGLFLDEFSNAPPAVRSAALRGILDSTWGDVTVDNMSTIAAMNPPELAESGYALSAPLANRFVHLDWKLDSAYWAEQLIAGFPAPTGLIVPIPESWEETHIGEARTLVASYAMRFGDAAMQVVPKSRADQSKPWPSLRSWTVVTRLLAACNAAGVGLLPDKKNPGLRNAHDVLRILVSGAVGEGAARQFLAYAEQLDLPDPETLLADPTKLVLPKDRGDKAFAILMSVAGAVVARNTPERWERGFRVLHRCFESDRPDLAVAAGRILASNQPRGFRLPKELLTFAKYLQSIGLQGRST
jgi:hypothetical protein